MEHMKAYYTHKLKRLFIFFFIILACFAVSGLVMILWNWLLPDLLKLPEITYIQATGLFILCRILFGGFRFGPPGGGFQHRAHWKKKWMSMTEEERMNLKAKWRNKCDPNSNQK